MEDKISYKNLLAQFAPKLSKPASATPAPNGEARMPINQIMLNI